MTMLNKTQQWRHLQEHYSTLEDTHIRDLFQEDDERGKNFH